MLRATLYASLLVVMLRPNEVRSQADSVSSQHSLESGEYAVGFQILEEQDLSRAVTGGVSATAHPRPMRIYLWYPARVSDSAQPMHFRRYAALADEDIWPIEIAGRLRDKIEFSRRALARSLGQEGFELLLRQPVLATEDAVALKGPFPLIVIGQGLYYETPVAFAALAEHLAAHGFVVATCPLVGTNSPFVRVDVQDLETQVRDLEFVIAHARRSSFVSPERLGVIGFDMGGMAGLILAMRNPDVDAFVSVSSGILRQHPSGIPRASPHYNPLALRVPWLHSEPAEWATYEQAAQDQSLFETAVHSERYLLLTDGMGHVDYTSYALIEGRSAMRGYWGPAKPEGAEGHKAVRQYVTNFFAAFLKQDTQSRVFLSQDPTESIPGSTMTLEHRPGAPLSITYEEFVQAVVAGQAEEAIDQVRALRGTNPDHMLLNEEYLRRLVASLSNTWGLTEEAMSVIKFSVELYPSSVGAQRMLAEGYIDSGDFPRAIEVYSALLEQNPNDRRIKSRLDWLRKQ